jgi:ribulose 1,5-bisphosphate synthetase/thiazole synthase
VNKSYWIESTPETSYPRVAGEIEVDVAVVGAGITGITAAYLLKEESADSSILTRT